MKIVALQAENIKRISVVEIRPDGNLVQITGPNGSGKTSVLDAIAWALQGTKGVQSQPIRKGHKTGRIKIDIGDLVVTRTFTEAGGTTLHVESADGARFPSPQAVLDRLLGSIAFDPLAFSRQKPKEQFETLKGLVKVDVDLDYIERHNASDYEKRTEVNREIKRLQGQIASAAPFSPELPELPIDTGAMVDEIGKAGEHNGEIDRKIEGRKAVIRDIETTKREAAELRERAKGIALQADELQKQIDTLRNHATNAVGKAEAKDAEAEKLRRQTDSLPPLPERIDQAVLRKRLDEAAKINQEVARRQEVKKHQEAMAKQEALSQSMTASIAERDQKKRDAIAAAKMPVEGISFGEGHVTLGGVPFEQASDAEQLRASCAIAMAMNPTLRVLRIRDGSLLDENGLKMLAEMAETNDYQVWVERVDTSGKVGIVMEDGHIKAAATEAAESEVTA